MASDLPSPPGSTGHAGATGDVHGAPTHPSPREMALVLLALAVAIALFLPGLLRGELWLGVSMLDKTYTPLRYLVEQRSLGWAPDLALGYPLALAPDLALFSPAVLAWIGLSSVLPPERVFTLLLPGLLLLGGAFCYRFVRRLGVGPVPALLAALAFTLNEFVLENLGTFGLLNTVVWLPLGLDQLERYFQERRLRHVASAGFVLGLVLLGGHLQMAVAGVGLAAAYAIFRALWLARRGQVDRGDALRIALVFTIAGGIAAVSLVPGWELVSHSARGRTTLEEIRAEEDAFLGSRELAGTVLLDHGLRVDDSVEFDPVYIGPVPVLLAALAFLSRRRRDAALFFGIAALGSLALCIEGTGLYALLYRLHLPGVGLFKAPSRLLWIVFVCVAILAALGLDAITSRLRGRVLSHTLQIGALLAAVGCLYLMRIDVQRQVLDEILVSPAELGELGRPPPVIGEARGSGRFYRHRDPTRDEIENTALWLGGAETSGRTLIPLDRYLEFVHASTDIPALTQHLPRQLSASFLAFPAMARLSGTTLVLLATPEDVAFLESSPEWDTAHPGPGHRVFRHRSPLDRVLFLPEALVLEDRSRVLRRLRDPDFDEERTVLLERGEVHGSVLTGSRTPGAAGATSRPSAAAIVVDRPNRVEIEVDAPSPGYLLLLDAHHPGWRAQLDGVPVPILHGDHLFRCVVVPAAGPHRVVFRYRPRSLVAGGAISLVTLVACGILFRWSGRRTGRRR